MRNSLIIAGLVLCICCPTIVPSGVTGPIVCCLQPSACLAQGIACPIADPLCQNLASQCTTTVTGTSCHPQKIIYDPLVPGGVRAINCSCYTGNECGGIVFIAATNAASCSGFCPVPPPGNTCNVLVNGVPSGQSSVVITAYPPGTTFECGCAVTTQPCTPNAAGTACNATQCPPDSQGLPQQCVPRCIRVDANGQQTIVECQCIPDNQCHIYFGSPAPNPPFCQGSCPQNFICERTASFDPADGSTTYCCDCHPDTLHCEPKPDGSACTNSTCPNPGWVCQPKCIEVDFNGQQHVIDCVCQDPALCHAQFGPVGGIPLCVGNCPQGFSCKQHVYPTANGTAYCCDCRQDPEFCEPTADGQNCTLYNCPPDALGLVTHCKPSCVHYNVATGQYLIRECDCRGDNTCYVDLGGPPPNIPHCTGVCPPGQYCVENRTQNADGSFELCCDCRPLQCECPGDIDGNGVINGLDIAGFTRCFLGTSQPGDNCACADINGDGFLNNLDIVLFVNRILTKFQCNPTPCCPKANLNLNLATGVDDNGVVLPANSNDPHWIVTLDASGGSVPRPATVVTAHPSWATFANSSWISANYFGPNGDYEYKFCFCLDPRAKNPVLSMQLRADDFGQVYLNGNFIGNASGFSVPNGSVPVIGTSNPSFFTSGQNCIVVKVQNVGGAPTGMNMIGSVVAQDGKCCCDPAPLAKDIRSGVYDNNGPFIAVGQDDDTWTVTCDATGGSTPRPAQVITPHPLWAVIPGTQWISATTGATNGWYCYQYCFCLDPRFKNAALNMQLLADDYAEVYLNGVLVGQTPLGWAFLNPPTNIFVTNQSLFKDCQNCIEIKVLNSGGVITGMDVAATVTATDGLCCDDRQHSCCLPNGLCLDLAPGTTQCDGQLMDGPCGNSISCCLPNGTCVAMPQRCCLVAGGTVLPVGTTCGGALQGCCLPGPGGTTICANLDPACCTARGGTPKGPGTVCLGDSNGDGNDDLCVPPPPVCPLGADFGSSLCANNQASQCQSNLANRACRPKVVITNGQGQGIFVEQCSCFVTGAGATCGPINIAPAAGGNYVLSCGGACGIGAGCTLFVNGAPFAGGSVNSGSLPAGSTVTCGCFIP